MAGGCIVFVSCSRSTDKTLYTNLSYQCSSAAIALCWLVHDKQMSLEDAQQHLSTRRRVRTRLHQQPNVNLFYSALQHKLLTQSTQEETRMSSDGSSSESGSLSPRARKYQEIPYSP
jgi:hypothetical protein